MQKFLVVIFLLVTCSSYSQEWTNYAVDPVLSVTIPRDHEVTDTLTRKVVTAYLEGATLVVLVIRHDSDAPIVIQNRNDLVAFYQEFQKSLIASRDGQRVRDEIMELDGLVASRFSFDALLNDLPHRIHCTAFFADGKTYVITFQELASLSDDIAPIRENFFSSLTVKPGMSINDQLYYHDEDTWPYRIGYWIGYTVVSALVLIGIVWLARQFRQHKEQKSPDA